MARDRDVLVSAGSNVRRPHQAPSDRFRVFISYSRRESALADRLVHALEARGFAVTIDRRDLPFGEKWQAELAEYIRLCDTVVWLVSDASIRSKWVNWELDQVKNCNKRLIPLMAGDTPRDQLPRDIGEIHILPAEGVFDIAHHLDALVSVLETDRPWLKEASRLQDRASEWIAKGRSSALLLSRGTMSDAELWRQRRPPKAPAPAAEVLDLLLASRQAATRRQRWWLAGVSAALVVSAGLASYALLKGREAQINSAAAQGELAKFHAASGQPITALRLAADVATDQLALGVPVSVEPLMYDILWRRNFPVSTHKLSGGPAALRGLVQASLASGRTSKAYALCERNVLEDPSEPGTCVSLFGTSEGQRRPSETYDGAFEWSYPEQQEATVTGSTISLSLGGIEYRYSETADHEISSAHAYLCSDEVAIVQVEKRSKSPSRGRAAPEDEAGEDRDASTHYGLLVNARTGRIHQLESYQASQSGPICHDSGRYVAKTGIFGAIAIYSVATGSVVVPDLLSLPTYRFGFDELAGVISISPERGLLLYSGANATSAPGAAGKDTVIQPRIFYLSEDVGSVATQRVSLDGHESPVHGGYFIDGGERVLTVTRGGTVRVWNVPDNAEHKNPAAEDELKCSSSEIWSKTYAKGDQVCAEGEHSLLFLGGDLATRQIFAYRESRIGSPLYRISEQGVMPLGELSGPAAAAHIGNATAIALDGKGQLYLLDGNASRKISSPLGPIVFLGSHWEKPGHGVVGTAKRFALVSRGSDGELNWDLAGFPSSRSIADIGAMFLTEDDAKPGSENEPSEDLASQPGQFHLVGDTLAFCRPADLGWGLSSQDCVFLDRSTLQPAAGEPCHRARFTAKGAACLSREGDVRIFDAASRRVTPVAWEEFYAPDLDEQLDHTDLHLTQFPSCDRIVGLSYSGYIRGGGGTESPGELIYDLEKNAPLWMYAGESRDDRELFCEPQRLIDLARTVLSALERQYDAPAELKTPSVRAEGPAEQVALSVPSDTPIPTGSSLPDSTAPKPIPSAGPAAQSQGPMSADALSKLTRHANLALEGDDTSTMRGIELAACELHCRATGPCQGFAYDKWNRWCFLKGSADRLRFDPQYESGSLRPVPGRSPKRVAFWKRKNKHFPTNGYRTEEIADYSGCIRACERDEACIALNYTAHRRKCEMLDTTPDAYDTQEGTDIAVRRQQ